MVQHRLPGLIAAHSYEAGRGASPPASSPSSHSSHRPSAAARAASVHHGLQPRGSTASQEASEAPRGTTGAACGGESVSQSSQHRAAPSLISHQVLMLRGGVPALVSDFSHEAAQQAREAEGHHRLLSQSSQHRAAPSLFSCQVLMLRVGVPALITGYSHDEAQRARGAPQHSSRTTAMRQHSEPGRRSVRWLLRCNEVARVGLQQPQGFSLSSAR
ncbi:unnamed protein product [Closterium sp. Naga37s-1]|nr:unnamed protein product [Closterium sp. Naga37s-1]